MAVRIEYNSAELRNFLHNTELDAELFRRASAALDYAKSIAPVGEVGHNPESSDEPYEPGAYRDSLHVERHSNPSRVSYRLATDDYKRAWIEYGSTHMPKFRVLGRTMNHVER